MRHLLTGDALTSEELENEARGSHLLALSSVHCNMCTSGFATVTISCACLASQIGITQYRDRKLILEAIRSSRKKRKQPGQNRQGKRRRRGQNPFLLAAGNQLIAAEREAREAKATNARPKAQLCALQVADEASDGGDTVAFGTAPRARALPTFLIQIGKADDSDDVTEPFNSS